MTILAICDNGIENNRQVLGVASQLASKYNKIIKEACANYNIFSHCNLLSYFFPKKFYSVHNPQDFDVYASIVISAGKKGATIASQHKKKFNSKWIQIRWPGYVSSEADILIIPEHELKYGNHNIIYYPGMLYNIDLEMLQSATQTFKEFENLKQKKIACFITAGEKGKKFSRESIIQLAGLLNHVVKKQNAYLFITTDGNMDEVQEEILKKEISVPNYFYNGQGPDPKFAFLYYADELIMMADSPQMISESLDVRKPIYVYDRKMSCAEQKKFVKTLIKMNYVMKLEDYRPFVPNNINLLDQLIDNIVQKLDIN